MKLLAKRVAELEMENAFLKKAAASLQQNMRQGMVLVHRGREGKLSG